MASGNKDNKDTISKDIKALRNQVFLEVKVELNRREIEMGTDVYANRPYSDGVRFEVGRMQQWLNEQMAK